MVLLRKFKRWALVLGVLVLVFLLSGCMYRQPELDPSRPVPAAEDVEIASAGAHPAEPSAPPEVPEGGDLAPAEVARAGEEPDAEPGVDEFPTDPEDLLGEDPVTASPLDELADVVPEIPADQLDEQLEYFLTPRYEASEVDPRSEEEIEALKALGYFHE